VEPSPDEPGVAVYRVPTVADQVVRGDVALLKLGAGKGGGGAADSTGEGGAGGASADGGGTTPKVPLGGVAFDIVRLSTGEVAARLVTGEDGRASTEGLRPAGLAGALPYGLYEVREDPATTPPGYRTAEPFVVAVEGNARTYCYEVVNELVSAPEEPPAGDEPAEEEPPAPLAETGDALARAPRCIALAAVISATLAAAFALRRQRP
ncbi:MSCRAMM family protein, partial [Gordonibacter urolithinfaciens]